MFEYLFMIFAVVSAVLALVQRDLLKAVILTGVSGASIAFIFQILLAPDVALTQAIVGAAIEPAFIALTVQRTIREAS